MPALQPDDDKTAERKKKKRKEDDVQIKEGLDKQKKKKLKLGSQI